jgi:hypothetical protein
VAADAFHGLLADADAQRFLARDPVVFVRRYAEPKDQEMPGAVLPRWRSERSISSSPC